MKTEDLIPYAKNPRKNDKAVDVVAKSIKEFGFKVPIILDKNKEIITGHTRLKAAIKLEMKEVPVIRADELTDAQVKAFRIADNKTGEKAEWQKDLLKEDLMQLQEVNYNLDNTGFSFRELSQILEKDVNEDIVEVNAYERAKSKTKIKQGEIYLLGDHRLLCGDATEKGDVEALMGQQTADMVLTDPPYNMNFTGSVHSDGSKSYNAQYNNIKNDNNSEKNEEIFINKFTDIIREYNKGSFYIFYYRLGAHKIINELKENYHGTIIWKKNNHTLSNSDYMSLYEPVIYGWTKEHNFYGSKRNFDVWEIERTQKNELHPTMKPIEVCSKAIKNSSKQNEIVLDLFGGSGSTLIACEQLNRKCFMIEIDPVYCQVIINRWEKYTGKKAVKA